MSVLENVEPKEVFRYFEEICNIPHGSYNEKEVSNYCVAFAKEHGLEVIQDSLFNVIIKKPATSGYENVPAIIIQGHLDMVCEKESGSNIDMTKEGLRLKINGDYVEAEGTTLGGDDGIAVAYALAVLAADNLSHPAIEAVFTIAEEVGMEGAAAIDLSSLKGKKLLNIDSEEEGVFLTSCAGGARVNCSVPVAHEEKHGQVIEVRLHGLKGGHSGVEINRGRANSNTLLGRFLMELEEKMNYELVELAGGSKDNAIPRESNATILIAEDAFDLFEKSRKECLTNYQNEYSVSDASIQLSAERKACGKCMVFVRESKHNAIMLLNALPNGIQKMSMHVEGLVETSLNLGIMTTEECKITFSYAVRSSVSSEKDNLIAKMKYLTNYAGGKVEVTGNYPGWEYKEESKLREDMIRIYEEMYGKKPEIQAIHAGVECGLISDKIQGIDCISFGPDMKNVHTTEEQLSISSTERVWEYIKRVIACK
ncbi:MAG: aminoacyl-histidine dipeptidase [Lachnospiraceae bacterium]|nr:aminoacyl-histidine dipeptidase [Lachnospiraceae bacterium]